MEMTLKDINFALNLHMKKDEKQNKMKNIDTDSFIKSHLDQPYWYRN